MNGKELIKLGSAVAALIFCIAVEPAFADGAAYTMTNADDNNQIVVFNRDDNGLLTKVDVVSTGGKGSGGGIDPLGSQGSLVLTDDIGHHGNLQGDEFLLAVNAGSNDVSVFRAGNNSIKLRDRAGSGGSFPVSLSVFGNTFYVLNNGAPANITGFKLDSFGHIHAIQHSTRLLGDGSYGQVAFDPRGKFLVIADKVNNRLLVYRMHHNGIPSAVPVITPSSGAVPFGVDFDRKGHLLVVEAGANAVSSYDIDQDGSLHLISASVPNGQAATCWIVVNHSGDVITTNPGTNSLSSFHIDAGTGIVTLLSGTAGVGDAPLDIDMSKNGRFAYAVDPGNGGIDMFRIEQDGSLTGLGNVNGGLSIFAQGMAVD